MKIVSLVLATVLAVSTLFIWGCSKESSLELSNTMKVSDYDYLGKMHNDFMSNALNNLNVTVTNKNQGDVLSAITAFNVDYAHKSYSNILPEDISSFNDFQEFLDNTAFNAYIL